MRKSFTFSKLYGLTTKAIPLPLEVTQLALYSCNGVNLPESVFISHQTNNPLQQSIISAVPLMATCWMEKFSVLTRIFKKAANRLRKFVSGFVI